VASRAEPARGRRSFSRGAGGLGALLDPGPPPEPIPSTSTLARPTAPTIGSALRTAGQDAYYHSWRLLPANVVWSVAALAVVVGLALSPIAVVLAPLVALPIAGIFRVTTRIARGEAVSFWDAIDAWRTDVRPTLAFGIGLVVAGLVLGSNVVNGLLSGSPVGCALATLAGWGLLATWVFAWTAWPILLDPARAGRPAADRLRLAGLLVLAYPLRFAAFGIALAVFLALSTVLVVALATISVAFAALVASRFVLPAADRLEARLVTAAPLPSVEIADTP
jgi:hypothetical protein